MHHVKFANFQIAIRNPDHQISMDVAGNDMAGRSDALCEPL